MILIQHVEAAERHKRRIEETTSGRHQVMMIKEFSEATDLSETEILFTFGKGISVGTLHQMPKLKWIQLCSTGFDHLPKDYILQQKIKVTTAKGAHVEPVAEYAFSCMLYFSRKMDRFLELQMEKKWHRFDYPLELAGSTAVIVGTGNIGKEIARRAQVFQMNTIGVSRSGERSHFFDRVYSIDQLEHALPQADYLILALPLTDQTQLLMKAEQLSLLKPSAVVINLGRGELMDEAAARETLQAERIRGMAIDVFHQEPLPKDSPWWDTKNLLITPHMAAKTDRFLDRSFKRFIKNYLLYVKGETMFDLADFSQGY